MSRPFAAVESFLERILERPAARLFHAHPQPVQLERRIERAMTAHKMVRGGHTYVPSKYRIVLHPADLVALREATDQLPDDLADAILARARSQGYWLVARPEVLLVPSARITQGDLEVDAEPLDPSLVSSAAAGLRPVGLKGHVLPTADTGHRRGGRPATGRAAGAGAAARIGAAAGTPEIEQPLGVAWIPLEATPPPRDDLAAGMPPVPADEPTPEPPMATAAMTPQEPLVRASIVVQGPDGAAPLTIGFEGGTLRCGRAPTTRSSSSMSAYPAITVGSRRAMVSWSTPTWTVPTAPWSTVSGSRMSRSVSGMWSASDARR